MIYRSECTCSCHRPGSGMLHIVACCQPDPKRGEPFKVGFYPEAALQISSDAFTGTRYFPRFDNLSYNRGITPEQCREAAHLLNQLAEYLECSIPKK